MTNGLFRSRRQPLRRVEITTESGLGTRIIYTPNETVAVQTTAIDPFTLISSFPNPTVEAVRTIGGDILVNIAAAILYDAGKEAAGAGGGGGGSGGGTTGTTASASVSAEVSGTGVINVNLGFVQATFSLDKIDVQARGSVQTGAPTDSPGSGSSPAATPDAGTTPASGAGSTPNTSTPDAGTTPASGAGSTPNTSTPDAGTTPASGAGSTPNTSTPDAGTTPDTSTPDTTTTPDGGKIDPDSVVGGGAAGQAFDDVMDDVLSKDFSDTASALAYLQQQASKAGITVTIGPNGYEVAEVISDPVDVESRLRARGIRDVALIKRTVLEVNTKVMELEQFVQNCQQSMQTVLDGASVPPSIGRVTDGSPSTQTSLPSFDIFLPEWNALVPKSFTLAGGTPASGSGSPPGPTSAAPATSGATPGGSASSILPSELAPRTLLSMRAATPLGAEVFVDLLEVRSSIGAIGPNDSLYNVAPGFYLAPFKSVFDQKQKTLRA